MKRFLGPRTVVVLFAAAILCGCASSTFDRNLRAAPAATPDLGRALNTALSWPAPAHVDALMGARLLEDGSTVSYPEMAIARAAMRTNPRITASGALTLARAVVTAARVHRLPPEFLGATLLQESAFDPNAISSAGAVGIAQFTIDTADAYDVDPFDPYDAIDGAAHLLGSYYRAYAKRYDDAFATSLAAYNAGPGAVAYYHGVPPYAETREYVALIFERWGRIASYERR
ncbi:MAG TPA: lytic transglycosylase domain-containing protein [Candidatus Aquilonibacter sp.]|nr:lytic transglycosylase domain-containing protein [Candidatus Aquilonibacter sp.]